MTTKLWFCYKKAIGRLSKFYYLVAMEEKLLSKKKPIFPITEKLSKYLSKYNRYTKIPVFYDDLLRFSGSIVVYNKHDEDTLWVRCYYPDHERTEIDNSLKRVYTILLEVSVKNIPAIKFYQSFGFTSEGTRKNYYAQGENAVLFNLSITKND